MRGHIHTDFLSLTLTAVGVFLVAHVIRVVAAQASQVQAIEGPAKAVGGFFTLG